MVSWPDLGTRVTVRYRRPAGSVPPLTDAVGHLLALDPMVRVRTKTGAVVEFAAADVVALRVLTDAPVRTADIRALEQASAAARQGRQGTEQVWLDGWLLRAGGGAALESNSAAPLDISAQPQTIPAIVAWYTQRDLTPLLAIPDRLLRPPAGLRSEHTEKILFRDAPDGTRWVGLSEVRAADVGAPQGATRYYVRVAENDTDTTAVAESLGFRLHHRTRYFPAQAQGMPPDNL
jgi:N-acetylglutamate synthase